MLIELNRQIIFTAGILENKGEKMRLSYEYNDRFSKGQ